MTSYHLAQCNIGRARGPMDGPIMAGFAAQLETINRLAEASPGFVWRLKDETGDATAIRIFDDDLMMVNMSVWESLDALFAYTYQTQHTDILKLRKEWFTPMDYPHLALWWLPAGELPTAQDARTRLDHLHEHGPSEWAFTFKTRFAAPG